MSQGRQSIALPRLTPPRTAGHEPTWPAALVDGFRRFEAKRAGTIRHLDESYQINRFSQWADQE